MQGEKELICRVLQSQRMGKVVASGIEAHHFHTYRAEWEYIADMWTRWGEVPTVKMFKEKFPDFRVRKIVGKDPSVAPAIEAVRDAHLELELSTLAEDFVNNLGAKAPTELMAFVTKRLEEINSYNVGEEGIDLMADIMADIEEFERVQRAEAAGEDSYIPTPFEPLNDLFGGFRGGEVIGMIARMGQGKSWISLQAAVVAMMAGHRPCYVPLEMGRREVANRMHTMLSWYMAKQKSPKHLKIPAVTNATRIKEMMEGRTVWRNMALSVGSNEIDVEEYRQWAKDAAGIYQRGFYMPKLNTFTEQFTFETFARHVEKSECDIAILDYLTLLDHYRGKNMGQWEVWTEITRQLKLLALKYDIPILVCAQANRNAVHNKTPELEDIAYSDSLGQNADRILSLRTDGDRTRITCIKNRKGQGRFHFSAHFYPDYGIIEYDKHQGVTINEDD